MMHHRPDFIPVQHTILIGVKVIELVLNGVNAGAEGDSLHGLKNIQSKLLELIQSQFAVVVFI